MSGAERNQRKRNQRKSTQATRAVAAARGSNSDRGKLIAGIVVVIVFAAVVVGIVLYSNRGNDDKVQAQNVGGNVPVKVSGAGIVAGKDDAKVKLDFYEDLICPSCGQFNKMYFDKIEQQLQAGSIQVTYHFLPFLDGNSRPAGYSGRAANATLSVAKNTPNKFVSYMHSLYFDQPEEGSAGYSDDQLISLGTRLGVGGTFAADVHANKYKATLDSALQTALPVMAKANKGNPATPTILHGDQAQQWYTVAPGGNSIAPSPWLDNLVSASAR